MVLTVVNSHVSDTESATNDDDVAVSSIDPAVEKILTNKDATELLRELLPAQKKSYALGLKLLPMTEVKKIHETSREPSEHLLQVIATFLSLHSRPTLKVIIDALRSVSVNLPEIATRLEKPNWHTKSLSSIQNIHCMIL